MNIGFTGTRKGMTIEQRVVLRALLGGLRLHRKVGDLHHGDCIGADAQFHSLAQRLFGAGQIVIHPPKNPKNRAYCSKINVLKPKSYLDRDKDIVDACDLLIACPAGMKETPRSGTWHTKRYAEKQGVQVVVIFPRRGD